MTIKIELLTDQTFPALCELYEKAYDRPRTPAFYNWLFRDDPRSKTVLAHQDGECLAMLSALARPYRLGEQTLDCLEPFQWYAVPELRSLGLGVRLLEFLKELNMPMVGLGGTQATRRLLPILGFETVATGHRYILPFSGNPVREGHNGHSARRRILATALDWAGPLLLRPRMPSQGARRRLVPVACVDDNMLALCGQGEYGLTRLHDRASLQWMTQGFAPLGTFSLFRFVFDDRLGAWALARVFRQGRLLRGRIVDVQPGRSDPDDLAWAVKAVAATLGGAGVDLIDTIVTSPVVEQAIRRNRFKKLEPWPVNLWPAGHAIPEGPVHIMRTRADQPFLPFPTSDEYELDFA